jgi:hypothetical protein
MVNVENEIVGVPWFATGSILCDKKRLFARFISRETAFKLSKYHETPCPKDNCTLDNEAGIDISFG